MLIISCLEKNHASRKMSKEIIQGTVKASKETQSSLMANIRTGE